MTFFQNVKTKMFIFEHYPKILSEMNSTYPLSYFNTYICEIFILFAKKCWVKPQIFRCGLPGDFLSQKLEGKGMKNLCCAKCFIWLFLIVTIFIFSFQWDCDKSYGHLQMATLNNRNSFSDISLKNLVYVSIFGLINSLAVSPWIL